MYLMSPTLAHNKIGVRRGTTVLEVLFAIFVVIIGLLGISSIIPLAARNASDSNAHNNAQALGQQWFQSFFTRGLNDHNQFTRDGVGYNWQWYRDYGGTFSFENFEKSYSDPTVRARVGIPAGLNQSPAASAMTSGAISRVWGHQAVCLDPTFFSEPDVKQRTTTASTRVLGYRMSVFPYFEDGYNPLTDPYSLPAVDPWQDQPRMLRATLGFGIGSQVSRKLVEDVFSSADDLAITTYFRDPVTGEQIKDDSIPAARLFQTDGSSISKGSPASEFSWLATVSAAEPRAATPATALSTSNEYLISLVVMHRRDKQFIEPGVTPIPGSAEDKPAGERLVWVIPLSGNFTGGTGGRVRLMANAATDDTLHIGDWIMLGKHYLIDPSDTTRRYAYFRWYRVIAVEQETQVGLVSALSPSGTDPYGNAAGQTVWSRDVVLEGPNFNFGSPTAPGVVTPTTGTLMSSVITVIERKISVK